MREKIVNGRWNVWVPDNIADWDGGTGDYAARRGWEYERFESFRRELRYGDVFVDVGAEHGWISAIIAREFVGAENMVLCEPSPEFWVNIRKTWEYNGLADPLACWPGFVGLSTAAPDYRSLDDWPDAADTSRSEVPGMAYRSLLDDTLIPTASIDGLCDRTLSRSIDAINIDVEGAELLVLHGAEHQLRTWHHLKVWVSVHPDLMEKFGHEPDDLHKFMAGLDYRGTHLATDHEEHWFFSRG